MLKIGIVGMGVIGHRVAEALTRGIPGTVLTGVSVRSATTAGGYPVLPLPTLIERADLIVEAATQAALREFGRVDAVLNVAGIGGAEPLAKITMEEYDRIMAVDLKGVLLGTKHGVKAMLPSGGGSIVNWSSIGGMNASTMPTSVYSAAKAGVISFTKSAAVEYGGRGIRANAICPGLIRTRLTRDIVDAASLKAAEHQGIPIGRVGEPEDIARCALFLASDDASFITGTHVVVDGGALAQGS